MSGVQRFFKAIFPARWGASMEADSRLWMVQCPCGYEQSIWEMGGIRWKATGNPRTYRKCVHCGERHWHKIYKRTESAATSEITS